MSVAQAEAPLLRVDGVSKSFGAVSAVADVSFTVGDGEVVGIMGPNGAGKTTLLNLIMGAMSLDTGIMHFERERISGLRTSSICRKGIGRTYQIPQPFRRMTVLENVMVGELYGGRAGSMAQARSRAMAVLDRVGLTLRADAEAGSLGLLELKRLELARALSLSPKLLLLDEIAAGLIESEVEVLKGILAGLKRGGQAMLIIEHVLSVLFDLSDRIIVLNFGKCIAEGTPAEVIRNTEVVEAYLGTEHVSTDAQGVDPGSPVPLWPGAPTPLLPVELGGAEVPAEPDETETKAPASTRQPLLRASGVSAAYGEFQALFDVSLEIALGEIVALIGLNGAGKTTLIRAITRQLPLLHGDVQWRGESIARVPPHQVTDLGIAQCLEGRKIFPEMTVEENLQLGAYCPRGRSHRDETLRRIYELFPVLGERRRQQGSTLSGGQQQMLAIGRALMARPDLVIFDEISLGLAPVIIDQLYEAIEEINRLGTTILLVEQSVERGLNTAHRAYVIERGRIALSGSAAALRADPEFRSVYFGL